MSMILVENPPMTGIVSYSSDDGKWLEYFDRAAAIRSVAAHVAALPSSGTEERYTSSVYEGGLKYWSQWAGDRMPTADLVREYIAHLKLKGLKVATINSKYLAVLRHYLKALSGQHIRVTGQEREFVEDCRFHIRASYEVKGPRPETTSNISPLWRADFVRLSKAQVNAVLRGIDRDTLQGKRDYAILLVAFNSALRVAELARVTLASIRRDGETWLITVRGKRNNIDPVPVGAAVVAAITEWVQAYNFGLALDDPRRIVGDVPIWQPLRRGGHPYAAGEMNPCAGISEQALRDVIGKRSAGALGDEFKMAAHDTRRTAAALAYDAGMGLPDIQGLLRHKSAAVTLHYIGQKPDHERRTLANFVQFG